MDNTNLGEAVYKTVTNSYLLDWDGNLIQSLITKLVNLNQIEFLKQTLNEDVWFLFELADLKPIQRSMLGEHISVIFELKNHNTKNNNVFIVFDEDGKEVTATFIELFTLTLGLIQKHCVDKDWSGTLEALSEMYGVENNINFRNIFLSFYDLLKMQ